jgi:hypothetical protein
VSSGYIPTKEESSPDEIVAALRDAVFENPRLREIPAEEVVRQLVLEGRLRQEPSPVLVAEMLNALGLEARIWSLVSDTLKDPVQLRADLDTMIEQERKARRGGDPEREAKVWLEKLAEVDRKRSAYQDQQAEGLLMLDELRAKLAALEETRRTAQRELEALRNQEASIAELEADHDALLDYYEKLMPDALDSLTPEERRRFYAMLRLEVILSPDGSIELRGAAFPEGSVGVCGEDTRYPSRARQSWSAGRKVTFECCTA